MLKCNTFFPGNNRQACEVEYAIFECPEELDNSQFMRPVCILVRQWNGTSLINSDEGRTILLNRILATDLAGVATEFIRFVVSHESGGEAHAWEFKIRVDVDDYLAKGNRADVEKIPDPTLGGTLLNLFGKGSSGRRVSMWSRDIVGGCANFISDFDEREHISKETLRALYAAAEMPLPFLNA